MDCFTDVLTMPGYITFNSFFFFLSSNTHYTFRARFTKQGKLALERNSIKAPMGGENSVGDLLTRCTLKNTDATSYFHNDQRNLQRVAQITACFNKTCSVWALINAANTSELTIANVSNRDVTITGLMINHDKIPHG